LQAAAFLLACCFQIRDWFEVHGLVRGTHPLDFVGQKVCFVLVCQHWLIHFEWPAAVNTVSLIFSHALERARQQRCGEQAKEGSAAQRRRQGHPQAQHSVDDRRGKKKKAPKQDERIVQNMEVLANCISVLKITRLCTEACR
jgi:hypothetical protein